MIDWHAIIASDTKRTALAWIPWEFPLAPSRWVLQVRRGGEWRTLILPGGRAGETFETQGADTIALTPVSRTGIAGKQRIWRAEDPESTKSFGGAEKGGRSGPESRER